jgi:hypothetical protein
MPKKVPVREDRPRRHPNLVEKRALKAAQVADYLRAVGRKAQKRCEPNDRRRVDLSLQDKLKRMSASEVDRLMREDED